jgi:hypothetical protein
MANATTRPAPKFESPAFIPASARLSALAKAALEANVSPADVRSYLEGRYAVRPMLVETTGVSL